MNIMYRPAEYAVYIRTKRFCQAIFAGEKLLETRNSPTLDSFIGQRVGVIMTGCGSPKLIGYVTISGRHTVTSLARFRDLYSLHQVKPGSRYDIKESKCCYWLDDPELLPEPVALESIPGNRVYRKL